MLRDFIIEYFPLGINVTISLLILVKIIAILSAGIKRGYFSLLIRSLIPYSKQFIKNTNDERLSGYLKVSNKLNYFFYSIVGTLAIVYVMMQMIAD